MKNRIILGLIVTLLLIPSIAFAQTPFADIGEGYWAKADIEAVYEKGLMRGVTENQFNPEKNISRAEMAVCLDRLFKFDLDENEKHIYEDVTADAWYVDAAFKAKFNGLLNTEDNKFQPNQPVTRIEVGSAIAESFNAKKLGVITTMMWPVYADTVDRITTEEQNALSFIVNARIMFGDDNNFFRPYDNITRAEFAVVLNRTAKTLENAFPLNEE